ncbi:MAG: S8 family peptidase [Cryomorphaceae bacterium]
MKHIIHLFVLLLSGAVMGQSVRPSKLPLDLRTALTSAHSESLIHLYVKGDRTKISKLVEELGGTIKYPVKDYDAIVIRAHEVLALDTAGCVDFIHFDGSTGQPLLSSSREHVRVDQVHQGGHGLPSSYTGTGVIVGVIDAGIELNHPDFQYPNGNTRIIEVWDQTMQVSQRTPSYGYGQVWDSTEINDSICPHGDQPVWYGHGTNTAGIAAGDGSSYPGYKGMAPGAELIVVASNFSAVGWTSTVADAVDYIFSKAEALGRPCVINASIGTYLGSHDARDLATIAIEENITAQPGRIMVCAAGNSGDQDPYHLGYEASSDTTFTWFRVQSGAQPGNGIIYLQLYGDVGDMERLHFAIGADQLVPEFEFRGNTPFDSILNRINVIYEDSLVSENGNFLGRVETYGDSLNGTYHLTILIDLIDSINYNYRLMVTGQGRFDLWSAGWLGSRDILYQNLPSTGEYPAMSGYKFPDIQQSIVGAWACSDKVITVGNMTNRTTYTDVDNNLVTIAGQTAGNIAENSSLGPARTGSIKPEVTAPGDNTLTAGAFFQLENLLSNPSSRDRVGIGGMHHRAGGTSSASPVVAGIGALFLEKCPQANWSDFKAAVTSSTFDEDAFTGSLPNHQWGYGKVDALNTLTSTTPSPSLVYDDKEFCDGEALALSLNENYGSIAWSTGENSASIQIDASGSYYAEVEDGKGCKGYSDTLIAIKRPSPVSPNLEIVGANPACAGDTISIRVPESFGSYAWNNGSFKQSIEVTTGGAYACVVSNIFQCQAISDTVDVSFYPSGFQPSLHLQEDGVLRLIIDTSLVEKTYWYFNEEPIEVEQPYWIEQPLPGIYQAAYEDSNSCTHYSEQINVYALGMKAFLEQNIAVFPNPVSDLLVVEQQGGFTHWRLIDISGRFIANGNLEPMQTIVDMGMLSSGVYQLNLIATDGRVHSKRVLK